LSILIISNLHGNNIGFQKILKKSTYTKKDTLIILGDSIDYGIDSKGVLDTTLLLIEHGFKVVNILGDHEEMLLKSINDRYKESQWIKNGGYQTLKSFKCNSVNEIPIKYINYLKSLPYYFMTEQYYFVHAGINMLSDMPLRDKQSLLTLINWQDKYIDGWLGNSRIIHGHTPLSKTEIINQIDRSYNVIGINNGNQIKSSLGYGQLCILNLEENIFIFED
jgi:serine/threonine protein phosphatase 1